jgi:hypothetical protein
VTGISYSDMLDLFLIPNCRKTPRQQTSCPNSTAFSRIITAGSQLSLMLHYTKSWLVEVDISGGRHGHPISHPFIFISGATSRTTFMFLLCHNPWGKCDTMRYPWKPHRAPANKDLDVEPLLWSISFQYVTWIKSYRPFNFYFKLGPLCTVGLV